MVTLIGSVVLAAGALLGIWLGAYYAAGRTVAQLQAQDQWTVARREDEAAQFAVQLEQEARRVDLQLRHDREMRDRDALRNLLDEGAVLIAEASGLLLDIEIEMADQPDEGEIGALRKRRISTIEGFSQYQRRLLMRFVHGNGVVRAVRSASTEFVAASKSSREPWDNDDDSRKKDFDAAVERFEAAESDFLGACRRRIGMDD